MNLAKQLDTKSILRNQRQCCTPTMKHQKQKSGKKSHLIQQQQKNKMPRNKPNLGGKRPVLGKLHNTEERNEGRHKQMEACTMLMDWKN